MVHSIYDYNDGDYVYDDLSASLFYLLRLIYEKIDTTILVSDLHVACLLFVSIKLSKIIHSIE